jgi:hypothetical protein
MAGTIARRFEESSLSKEHGIGHEAAAHNEPLEMAIREEGREEASTKIEVETAHTTLHFLLWIRMMGSTACPRNLMA